MDQRTRQILRKKAEQRLLEQRQGEQELSAKQTSDLIHELQVHQIELEMQNDELRRVQEELIASRDRFVGLYDFAPIGYLTLNEEGLILDANLILSNMLGIVRKELVGQPLWRYVHRDEQDTYFLLRRRFFASEKAQIGELNMLRSDGSPFTARLNSVQIQYDDLHLCRIVVSDISELAQTESELRLAAKILESTIEGIMVCGTNGNILTVNQAFTTITGYRSEEVIGRNPRLLKSSQHDVEFYKRMWHTLAQSGQWQGEISNRRKNGEIYPQWMNISAVKNKASEITNYVGVFSDISLLKEAEAHLQHLATHDVLTNLPNRRLFWDRLEHAIAQAERHTKYIALLFLDLDRFKGINDSLGHSVGDQVLQVIAERLTTCLRKSDTVARMGGDEFTILLEDFEKTQEITGLAQKILEAVAQPIQLNGQELTLTASIGISLYPDDGQDPETLMKNADQAMYHAKEDRPNHYRLFAADMYAAAREYLLLKNSLRHALERNELCLQYQPQVDLRSGQIVGVEALLRWQHPELGLIPPATLIPLAEETGLMVPIFDWVLRTACQQNTIWQAYGETSLKMTIAVNLSVQQYHRHGLVDLLEQILKDVGLRPEWVEVELTEGILIKDPEQAVSTLNNLRTLGVGISLDDFGTGYSSLSYLNRFPISMIKIDRSFVANVTQDTSSAAIITAIINLAHALGLVVIAEGVETQEQLNFLRSQNCDRMQGFYFSAAQDAEQITQMLLEGRRLVF